MRGVIQSKTYYHLIIKNKKQVMKTLKFKALRNVVRLREYCSTADGECTLTRIFTFASVSELLIAILLIFG